MAPIRMQRRRSLLHAAALHIEQDTPAVKIDARGKVAAMPATAPTAGENARIFAACRRAIVGGRAGCRLARFDAPAAAPATTLA